MIGRFLQLFVGRTLVRERGLPHAVEMLRSLVKESSPPGAAEVPRSAAEAIIQDAIRRAAEEERDGRARVNRFLFHVEEAAKKIVAIRSGSPDSDSRIRSILEFHSPAKLP